jgi:hypothetical protein
MFSANTSVLAMPSRLPPRLLSLLFKSPSLRHTQLNVAPQHRAFAVLPAKPNFTISHRFAVFIACMPRAFSDAVGRAVQLWERLLKEPTQLLLFLKLPKTSSRQHHHLQQTQLLHHGSVHRPFLFHSFLPPSAGASLKPAPNAAPTRFSQVSSTHLTAFPPSNSSTAQALHASVASFRSQRMRSRARSTA